MVNQSNLFKILIVRFLATVLSWARIFHSEMPATALCVKEDGIHRYNERSNTSEPVSNFTIKLTASVENGECGSSVFLVLVKRVPDEVER